MWASGHELWPTAVLVLFCVFLAACPFEYTAESWSAECGSSSLQTPFIHCWVHWPLLLTQTAAPNHTTLICPVKSEYIWCRRMWLPVIQFTFLVCISCIVLLSYDPMTLQSISVSSTSTPLDSLTSSASPKPNCCKLSRHDWIVFIDIQRWLRDTLWWFLQKLVWTGMAGPCTRGHTILPGVRYVFVPAYPSI